LKPAPEEPTISFDVIGIGAGAGGLAAAYKLVAAGKRVLVIEKGRTVAAADNISRPDLLLSGFGHRCAETWLDAGGRPFLPNEYSNVGGKTKWYGAALLRMSPREFEPEPSYGALGWPVSYKEFAKHYAESESIFTPTTLVWSQICSMSSQIYAAMANGPVSFYQWP
jgi:choline dehydrogenase-like flavoprotein